MALNTENETFIITVAGTDRKIIFQDIETLEEALEADSEFEVYVDTDSLRQLNRFDRFVKLAHTPTYMLEFLCKNAKRRAESITKRLNDM